MAATAKIGFGTLLEIEKAGTPDTYDTIGGITSLKPPGVSAEVIDRTTMQSPGKTKQKMGGLKDWGQVSVNINYDPADSGHAALMAAVGETKNFRIVFPDGSKWKVAAVASNFEPGEVTKEGLITASFTADIDGVPTFEAAV
jgi:predicted secreted protein